MLKPSPHIEALETRIAPATIFAVEVDTNKLVSFDSKTPGAILTDVAITGLQPNEVVVAIDFNPVTRELFALGLVDDGATRTGRLRIIDPVTGAATLAGTGTFSSALDDTDRYGFDFEPSGEVVRLVDVNDNNYRLKADDGTLAGTDTDVNDPVATEDIVGLAYTTDNTLYGYNFSTDELVIIGGKNSIPSPNGGVITVVAPLKVGNLSITFDSSNFAFDIARLVSGPEQGWILGKDGGSSRLYLVNLATGGMDNLGAVGPGTRNFAGMSVQLAAAAPAISGAGKIATWTDLDGDIVTLKITQGTLTGGNFTMLSGASGSALARLTLTDSIFKGTNVTITAKPGPTGGDGFVNIGHLNAAGVDLGAVSVPGDLTLITAGESGGTAMALKSLTARSIATQGSVLVTNTLGSGFDGPVGKINIAGDFLAFMTGSKFGSVTIGGSMGKLGNGGFIAAESIGTLVVKGDVDGTSKSFPSIQTVTLGSATIGGNLIGGVTNRSGSIVFNSSGPTKISVGGSLFGGPGNGAGSIISEGTGSVTIVVKGSLDRKTGSMDSANIQFNSPATITVGGSLLGGAIAGSTTGGILKSLTVGGNIEPIDGFGGINAKQIGSVTIKGSVIGKAAFSAYISAVGNVAPSTQAAALAIGKITVVGDVIRTVIGAGFESTGSLRGDAAIGSIKIGRNLVASSISAGVTAVAGGFGDGDDMMNSNNLSAAIVSRIASIAVGGQIYGTFGGGVDNFGIQAEQIGSIKVGAVKLPLTPAANDFLIGLTGDVRIREF